MADNSTMAFQIYKTIEAKQNELIKKNAIKPEEIQELSEESFIKELQASVNFHTKNISNNSVISEIYKEILKQVDRISDISQITTSSGIKLPEEMIREGVKLASERASVENTDDYFENDNSNNELISQFNDIESLDEKINFYESLSDNEKEAIRKDVYIDLFGEETADELLSQDKDAPCEKSKHYRELENKTQDGVREVINSNNIVTYIMKNLSINVDETHINLDMAEMGFVISRLKKSMDKNGRIDENASKEVLKVLTSKMNFPQEKAREIIRYFEEQYKENPKFYADISEFRQHKLDSMRAYMEHEEPIKDFLQQQGIPFDEALRDTFSKSFDKNGKLNIDAVIVNLELLTNNKEGNLSTKYQEVWERMNMSQFKIDMQKYFDSQSKETDYQEMEMIKGSKIGINNTKFFEEIKRKKIEEGYAEKASSNDNFDKYLKANKLDIERNLLIDFSIDKMSEMITDTYSSDFMKNIMFGMEKTKRQEEPSKKIEDETIDVLYSNKFEELSIKQEEPAERTPEIPKDIMPETLDFNVGEMLIQTANNEKTSPTAKITDIRRLIEKQGHMEDIVATIAKVSEIGKNGIAPIEQGKMVEGNTQSEQNPATPSDEEKE